MSKEENLKRATSLLMTGRRKEAAIELLNLYKRPAKKWFRLQLIDALLSALDPTRENQKLIDMSSEGIELAEALQLQDLQAHFMARRADFLTNKLSFLHFQRANLKLTPGWIGFSTESDKNSYDSLTAEIESLDKEINKLLSEATKLTKQTSNKKVLGFILMSKGNIESSHYLDYKLSCIQGTRKSRVRLLFNKWGYEISLLFGFKHYKKLKAFVVSFTTRYLEAARLLEEIGDDAAGLAYYDLSVHLKTAYRFRQAKNYLRKAKIIAKKHNSIPLNTQITELEKSIKARNRDIPNYIEGETRAGREEG